MKPVQFREILSACGGTYHGDAALLDTVPTDIVIDSRVATPGSLYIPIVGERFDGHEFINNAREKGSVLVLSAKPLESETLGLASVSAQKQPKHRASPCVYPRR